MSLEHLLVPESKEKKFFFKLGVSGCFPGDPWLRFHLPMEGVKVQSLIREPRTHMPHGQKTKTQNRSNIATN